MTHEITTTEQLAALPEGTVMRARNGQLTETGNINGEPCVWEEGWSSHTDAIEHFAPLTVLHDPSAPAVTDAMIEAAKQVILDGVPYSGPPMTFASVVDLGTYEAATLARAVLTAALSEDTK